MRRIAALLTVIVLLMTMSVACTKPLSTLSATELIDLGEKYLLELDYEQALVQFLKMIEVEPMNPCGYTGVADAYVGLGQSDNAKPTLEQGKATIGEEETIQSMLDEIHKADESHRQAEIDAEETRKQAEREAEVEIEIKGELNKLLGMYEDDGFDSIPK